MYRLCQIPSNFSFWKAFSVSKVPGLPHGNASVPAHLVILLLLLFPFMYLKRFFPNPAAFAYLVYIEDSFWFSTTAVVLIFSTQLYLKKIHRGMYTEISCGLASRESGMVYERPDQAVHKPESNLTWVRGGEVDVKVKRRERYFCFRQLPFAYWFKNLYFQRFQRKGKVSQNQGEGEERPLQNQGRNEMSWKNLTPRSSSFWKACHSVWHEWQREVEQVNFTPFLAFLMQKADSERGCKQTGQLQYFAVSGGKKIWGAFFGVCGVLPIFFFYRSMKTLFETSHVPSVHLQNFIRRFH